MFSCTIQDILSFDAPYMMKVAAFIHSPISLNRKLSTSEYQRNKKILAFVFCNRLSALKLIKKMDGRKDGDDEK